jgi:hypothetical protein
VASNATSRKRVNIEAPKNLKFVLHIDAHQCKSTQKLDAKPAAQCMSQKQKKTRRPLTLRRMTD